MIHSGRCAAARAVSSCCRRGSRPACCYGGKVHQQSAMTATAASTQPTNCQQRQRLGEMPIDDVASIEQELGWGRGRGHRWSGGGGWRAGGSGSGRMRRRWLMDEEADGRVVNTSVGEDGRREGRCNGERDRPVIHALLDNREAIQRSVDVTPTGVKAHTRSDDPQVAAWIKQHVASMKARVENNDPIRLRDPLFAAVFQNAKDMRMDVEYLNDGVKVVQDGNTPCAQALVKAHADVVSGFIDRGRYEVWANHEVPQVCLGEAPTPDVGSGSEADADTAGVGRLLGRAGGLGRVGRDCRHEQGRRHRRAMHMHQQQCRRVPAGSASLAAARM